MKTALLICIGIVALATTPAHAGGDFCITETSPPNLQYIGQKFSIPARGKCKPWLGFSLLGGETFPSTGSACTSTDGTHVIISISTTPLDGFADAEHAYFDLSLPSLTLLHGFESALGPGTAGAASENSGDVNTVSVGICSPAKMPIP